MSFLPHSQSGTPGNPLEVERAYAEAPAEVAAAAMGEGKVRIAWKNPGKDFDYAKVYRSAKAGELGIVRAATLRASQFTDSEGLTDGATYYYTVRAVDPAGNESANVTQVSVRAKGTSGAAAAPAPTAEGGAISRTLVKGMSGDEVTILQKFLVNDGLLVGSATGYFGSLTEAAVKQFQTKLGLEPVGIVGPRTRAEVNARLGAPSAPPAPASAGGGISGALQKGASGDEVKTLQQFLISRGVLGSGSATGYFGSLTEAAVKKFQAEVGLEQVGIVGPITREKIKALQGQ